MVPVERCCAAESARMGPRARSIELGAARKSWMQHWAVQPESLAQRQVLLDEAQEPHVSRWRQERLSLSALWAHLQLLLQTKTDRERRREMVRHHHCQCGRHRGSLPVVAVADVADVAAVALGWFELTAAAAVAAGAVGVAVLTGAVALVDAAGTVSVGVFAMVGADGAVVGSAESSGRAAPHPMLLVVECAGLPTARVRAESSSRGSLGICWYVRVCYSHAV